MTTVRSNKSRMKKHVLIDVYGREKERDKVEVHLHRYKKKENNKTIVYDYTEKKRKIRAEMHISHCLSKTKRLYGINSKCSSRCL